MNWIVITEIVYVIILLLVILRVVFDTRSGTKALAYVLFIILVPVAGMLFYFSFGVNYRKRKLYSKKLLTDRQQREMVKLYFREYFEKVVSSGLLPEQYQGLSRFIKRAGWSPLIGNNQVKLLINGEEKLPVLIDSLKKAEHHIHFQYYIYEDDFTGNEVADILIEKAKQGLEIRFLYDDFGSHSLRRKFLSRLEEAGIKTAPFYKVKWYTVASRINYRNHRKIVIIDGKLSFMGGINISDRYRNDLPGHQNLFWRDTHLMLSGRATFYLQYIFMCDWNFCNKNDRLLFGAKYFPIFRGGEQITEDLVQIVASGPDSDLPMILYSLKKAIGNAKKEILITSPYFIPGESMIDLLIIAAQSGVDVKILVPGVSDSKVVNAAARHYYSELLRNGARIFLYQKGFVHSKTLTIDDSLSVVGSANFDHRSFDLNFEVNAIIYGKRVNSELRAVFEDDLTHSVEIDKLTWLSRPKYKKMWDKLLRLLSPFL